MISNRENRLVEYLSSACTNTGQATFYNSREEQAAALGALHNDVLEADRRVYALSAALPINDRNRQMVVMNLLMTGRFCQNQALENRIVQFVTRELPFNRALNMLVDLAQAKINNARLRRVCRAFWDRHGDAFHAIKYRSKFRQVLRHCHIGEGEDPYKAEVHRFIFGRIKNAADVKYNELICQRLLARDELEACFRLPFDIGRDIAVSRHGISAKEFTERFSGATGGKAKGRLTRKESLRANKQVGAEVNFDRFSLFELLEHGHRVRESFVGEERGKFFAALDRKSAEQADYLGLPQNVHVVVDNSGSARGSDERAFHALAVIEATARVLRAVKNSDVTMQFVSDEAGEDLFADLFVASGATDLRLPLAKALAAGPDLVVILSDGYENVAAGSVAQILATQAVRESGIAVVHVNPVAAAEAGGVRKLSDQLPTFGLSAPQQLAMSLLLGESAANPQRLVSLFDRVEKALEGNHREVTSRVKGLVQRIGR